MWAVCLSHAERHDADMLDRWKADMDGILIYTGVFSATVAAFLIESYKYLKIDSTDVSSRLLEQVTQQLAAISNGQRVTAPTLDTFTAPRYAIRVNILWFLSLCIALSAGLGATLVQQWIRRYNRLTRRSETPIRRVRIRTFLFGGMKAFHMRWFIENVSLMLHTAIFLFFVGLVDFLFAFNDEVASVVLVAVSLFAAIYITLTAHPVVFRNSPFQTPLTSVLWYAGHIIALVSLFLFRFSGHVRTICEEISKHVNQGFELYLISLVKHKSQLDKSALRSTLSLCRDDSEVEAFLDAIPGYLQNDTPNGSPIDDHHGSRIDDIGSLLNPKKSELSLPLGHRIGHALASCVNGDGRMEDGSRRRRAITCSRAISEISKAFLSLDPPVSVTLNLPKTATSKLQLLSRDHDLKIASAALHATAVLERALLEQLSDAKHKHDIDRSTMTAAVLADAIGENDSGSTRYRIGMRDEVRSDGRLIAVTEFLLGVLVLMEKSWKPSHEDLEEFKWTLEQLCRGLNGREYSDAAQERFAGVLGDVWDVIPPVSLSGTCCIQSLES
ncbi:hypothetical protein F5148DRAFT_1191240 [Russula earlei]|uniref:Uncharacterized protein n=1 Tax=Russula earlei TaxID=71964 RepID=A0ACC0UCK4_9AGAM|nr:hypothetical protein F5148DRAFT_1191240 [Russula earlei]